MSSIVVHALLVPGMITTNPTVGILVHAIANVAVVIGAMAAFYLEVLNISVCMSVFAATTDGPALGCALASSLSSCPFAF